MRGKKKEFYLGENQIPHIGLLILTMYVKNEVNVYYFKVLNRT